MWLSSGVQYKGAGVFVVRKYLSHRKAIRVQSKNFMHRRLSISVVLNWCSIAESSSLQKVVFINYASVATTFNLVDLSVYSKRKQSSLRNIPKLHHSRYNSIQYTKS